MNRSIADIQVVGLGQASLDYLGRIPFYPEQDGKVELMDLHMQCGGPASTALVTLSRLGIATSFIGSISDDPLGQEILKGLKEEKVDTRFLKITPGYSSQFAFIAIAEKTGKRNIFWRRGSAPFLRTSDVDLSPFLNVRVLHLDGLMIDASVEAARQARDMGIRVLLDAGTMREGSRELVRFVDVLIASEQFSAPLVGSDATPETALEALKELCPGDVVITLGPRGSLGSYNNKLIYQDAFPVRSVDTTGAGDVYHGAYIYGLLKEWDMVTCMRFASATAAMKCRKIGARQGIPTLHQIKKFMDSFDQVLYNKKHI